MNRPEDGQAPDTENLDVLFDVLMEHVPAPKGDSAAPLQAHVTNARRLRLLGRLALVRIHNGELRKGQNVAWMHADGVKNVKITELLKTVGVNREPGEVAVAGDIVAVAGIPRS